MQVASTMDGSIRNVCYDHGLAELKAWTPTTLALYERFTVAHGVPDQRIKVVDLDRTWS